MYTIDYCPCCMGKNYCYREAVVAPFIATYVLNEPISTCKLLRCLTCDFIFFNKRFTDNESQKLYGKYRQSEYFDARHKYEFWYTREVNEASEDPAVRKENIFSFINDIDLNFDKLENILDYGGDRGQYFHESFANSKKWLYDLSDYSPVEGVTKIKKLSDDLLNHFQFVMMCHLLEHLSEPSDLLDMIHNYISVNGYLYIEVPSEQFSFSQFKGDLYGKYVSFMINRQWLFTINDIASLLFRLKLGLLPTWGIIKLHEHINFFNQKSLEHLLSRCGYKVLKISEKNVGVQKSGRNMILQCLAQRVAK